MRVAPFVASLALMLGAGRAVAAPEAHLFRVDAREAPRITTVIEVSQPRRLADVTAPCAKHTGARLLDCLGDTLERPGALAGSVAFPVPGGLFTVAFGRSDSPLAFESATRWGDASSVRGAGTAWLVLVDVSAPSAPRAADARKIARAFVDAMRPSDVADVIFLDEAGVSLRARWSADKAKAALALAQPLPAAARGPAKPFAEVIQAAADESYADLASASSGVAAPLHQAMVLLSAGTAGDAASAARLRDHLSRGRFGGPKMPVPVISIWLPENDAPPKQARQMMEGIANPELGGFFTAVRAGRAGRAAGIVAAVRSRFDEMVVVRWKLTCTLFGKTQSWKLSFPKTTPLIAGDATFTDVAYDAPPPKPCK